MKIIKKIILLLFGSLMSLSLLSQEMEIKEQVKIATQDRKKFEKIITCGKDGILHHYMSVEDDKYDLNHWKFTFLDNELSHVWDEIVKIDEEYVILDQYYDSTAKKVYLFSTTTAITPPYEIDDDGRVAIFVIDILKKEKNHISLTEYQLDMEDEFEYRSFLVYENYLYLFPVSQAGSSFFGMGNPEKQANILVFNTDKKNDYDKLFINHTGNQLSLNYALLSEKGNILSLGEAQDPGDARFERHLCIVIDASTKEIIKKDFLDSNEETVLGGLIRHKPGDHIFVSITDDRKEIKGEKTHVIRIKHFDTELNKLEEKEYSLLEHFDKKRINSDNDLVSHPKSYQLGDDGKYMIVFESMHYSLVDGPHNTHYNAYMMIFNDDNDLLKTEKFSMQHLYYTAGFPTPRLFVRESPEEGSIFLALVKKDKMLTKMITGELQVNSSSFQIDPGSNKEPDSFTATHAAHNWYNEYILFILKTEFHKNAITTERCETIFYKLDFDE